MLNSMLTSPITLSEFLICVFVALLLGLLAGFVFYAGTNYTSSWKIAITLLPMVVCVIIMMVNGNVGAGLAVAGTVALVRFRSEQGSAKEVTGLFFAVAIGLMCGMGYIWLALIFTLIMSAAVLILTKLHYGEMISSPSVRKLIVTIPENLDYETIFDDIFEKYTSLANLTKVRTTNMGTLYELTYEVVLKDDVSSKEFIDELRCRNGNLNIIFSRPKGVQADIAAAPGTENPQV